MESIFGQVLDLSSSFSPWLVLALFLLATMAELGATVPLLLETVWLFTGYHFITGTLPAHYLVLFVAVTLAGRLTGSAILFTLSWYGKTALFEPLVAYCKPRLASVVNHAGPLRKPAAFLTRLFCKLKPRISQDEVTAIKDTRSFTISGHRFRLSPLTVAMGRFVWLRIPLTIGLGAARQRFPLFGGVAIFSVAWDAAYIIIGVAGGNSGIDQTQMALYPLGAIITISALVFAIKRLKLSITARRTRRAAAGGLPFWIPAYARSMPVAGHILPMAFRVPDAIDTSDLP